MSRRRLLGSLAREPLYNTRAVAKVTEVPVDTIRAWERRYNVPQPYRTPSNHRLYSELDIGIIIWLRERTEEGMTISQAIQRLKLEHPDLGFAQQSDTLPGEPATPVAASQDVQLRKRLFDAAAAFDSVQVERVLDDGLARFSVEAFCSVLIEPIVTEMKDDWETDGLRLAARSFLRRILDGRLAALARLSTISTGRGQALLVLGEDLDLTGRILEVLLARNGWSVMTLGAGLPADAITAAVETITPALVCLHVSNRAAANLAHAYAQIILSNRDHTPRVVLSLGQMSVPLRSNPGVAFVTGTAAEMVEQIGASTNASAAD